jgi:hypothetical protein
MLYPTWLGSSLLVFVPLIIWETVWKGIACYKAGTHKQGWWFFWMFILNTVGILPILYILFFQKKEEQMPKRRRKRR